MLNAMQVTREPANLDSVDAGQGDRNSDEAGHAPTSNGFSEPNGLTATAGDNDKKRRDKPKQKRNKPTLSCLECVERKTKCDRARPCLACVKRQSACEYTAVANLIASSDRKNSQPSSKAR